MMEIGKERLLTMAEAAKLVPGREQGKCVHVQTLYRWCTKGCGGVVLETIRVGGRRCTTRTAIQRFFSALSGSAGDGPGPAEPRADQEGQTRSVLVAAGISTGSEQDTGAGGAS